MTESCTPRLCWLVHSLVRCCSVRDLDLFRDGSLGCASHTSHAENTRDKMTRAAQRALAAAADSAVVFMVPVWYVELGGGGLSPPLKENARITLLSREAVVWGRLTAASSQVL